MAESIETPAPGTGPEQDAAALPDATSDGTGEAAPAVEPGSGEATEAPANGNGRDASTGAEGEASPETVTGGGGGEDSPADPSVADAIGAMNAVPTADGGPRVIVQTVGPVNGQEPGDDHRHQRLEPIAVARDERRALAVERMRARALPNLEGYAFDLDRDRNGSIARKPENGRRGDGASWRCDADARPIRRSGRVGGHSVSGSAPGRTRPKRARKSYAGRTWPRVAMPARGSRGSRPAGAG